MSEILSMLLKNAICLHKNGKYTLLKDVLTKKQTSLDNSCPSLNKLYLAIQNNGDYLINHS